MNDDVFIISLLIVLLGFFFANIFSIIINFKDFLLVAIIYVWHTIFCVLYWYYSLSNSADANMYYLNALNMEFNWRPGTPFISSICSVLIYLFDLSKLNLFLVFNMFGVLGLLVLGKLLKAIWCAPNGEYSLIPYLILFFPGLNFWTSAIGKDGLAFLSVCITCYLLYSRKYILIVFPVLLMVFVRPHIALLMLGSVSIVFVISKEQSLILRALYSLFMVISSMFLFNYVIQIFNLTDVNSISAASDYVETRAGFNQEGGGGIDVSTMSLPMAIFTYLFRPLFFDSPNMFGYVVSIENIILLYLSAYYFKKILKMVSFDRSEEVRYNLIFFVLFVVICSITTSNLGISIRQKTMILPSLFVLMALSSRYHCYRKIKNQSLELRGKALK